MPGSSLGRRVIWPALTLLLALAFLLDGPVMHAVYPLRDSSFADFLRDTIRWLGIGYVQAALLLLLIGAGALLRLRALSAGSWGLLSFVLSGVAGTLVKIFVHRPRPWTEGSPAGWSDIIHNSDFHSFPSGETTTTFAVALSLAAWYPRWRLPLVLIAAAVGVARVLVGSHHPSDVVAGAMLGIAVSGWVVRRARRKAQPGSAGEA